MSARRVALALGLVGLLAVVLFLFRPRHVQAASYASFPDTHPSVLVAEPHTLVALEDVGFSFADVLGIRKTRAPHDGEYIGESAGDLKTSAAYADLTKTLRADLAELEASVPSVGVGVRFKHRLFDVRWLESPHIHYELVGVVDRIDFRHLTPPGCGQTRLVYRMTYRPSRRPQTRLPLTLSVLYENKGPDCARLAHAWLALEDGGDLARRLATGPLAERDVTTFDRIEINVQSLREDSQGKEMDDHGEYILRSFVHQAGGLVPGTLRNTPDPNLDADSKAALASWIVQNVSAIDDGSAEVPERFLATRAVSFTPRSLSRGGNRPYKALYPDERNAFSNAPLEAAAVVRSPQMLVRRLDEMTCPGCHEARAVAGFHLLGEERSGATDNALTLGMSEHLRQVIAWRYRFLQAAAEGHVLADPVPISEHVDDSGAYGAHCTHPRGATTDDGLPEWTCAPGLSCRRSDVEGDPIGTCGPPDVLHVGDACERVQMAAGPDHDGDPVRPLRAERCRSRDPGDILARGKCNLNRDGFPGGMCTSTCTEGEQRDGSICMRIPHKGFERSCFRPGVTLEECLQTEGNFAIERMRSCSRSEPCRDDFVCSRAPGLPIGEGACVPPYFIFQARVDGPPVDR